MVRSLSFSFLDELEGNANMSVATKYNNTVAIVREEERVERMRSQSDSLLIC